MHLKKTLVVALAAAMTGPLTFPVMAQNEGLSIEEVVVIARKRSENMQEVPIAISAIGEDAIQRAGIERAAEYVG